MAYADRRDAFTPDRSNWVSSKLVHYAADPLASGRSSAKLASLPRCTENKGQSGHDSNRLEGLEPNSYIEVLYQAAGLRFC
jgi:hypothetical protein